MAVDTSCLQEVGSSRPVCLLERNKVLFLKAGLGIERVDQIVIGCVAGDNAELVQRYSKMVLREEVVAEKKYRF